MGQRRVKTVVRYEFKSNNLEVKRCTLLIDLYDYYHIDGSSLMPSLLFSSSRLCIAYTLSPISSQSTKIEFIAALAHIEPTFRIAISEVKTAGL